MKYKLFFWGSIFLGSALTAQSQVTIPDLQAVTGAGNTTTNSIIIENKDGLNIRVDPVNSNIGAHYLRASPAESRTLRFDCTSNDLRSGWEFYNSNENQSLVYIRQSPGNVGIGTINPMSRLSVNGEMLAIKVKATLVGWPDYVFESGYKLPSLEEVQRFISIHKHLPDMPSAKEISEHDLDLGANQARLLQKIEEMTLYLIEQDKALTSQEQLLHDSKRLLADREKRLAELEAKIENK